MTLKAQLLAESIATASLWCEAVLYSPDSPFLFGGGSGNETNNIPVQSLAERLVVRNLDYHKLMKDWSPCWFPLTIIVIAT